MRIKLAVLLGLAFFLAVVFTLPYYGINWDTINHLPRGQAYLHYFLTGKRDFNDLPSFEKYWQNPESLGIDTNLPEGMYPLRSYYESDASTFNWFMTYDGDGHPPLSDILASVSNQVLFKKLHLLNDIDAYRVYGIVLAAILVGVIFYWVSGVYGTFSGFVSAVVLALYPLFWSESHFNTEKDIPEAAYWSFFLLAVYKSIVNKSWKWMLFAGVIFGFALGTKFNIVFAPLVIIPWIIVYLVANYSRSSLHQVFSDYRKVIICSMLALIVGVAIFTLSWPYLWQDLYFGYKRVFGFYKTIGVTGDFDVRFLGPGGINFYPSAWIILTSPEIVLIVAAVGSICAFLHSLGEKDKISLLFLLWLFVPITRVSMPGSNIYGGVRQIMEFVPAMAIMAGVGVGWIIKRFSNLPARLAVGILFLVLTIYPIVRYFPNENVYFNSIIGGLKGARAINIPGWGNSFGAAYRQAIAWINKNAEPGAKLVFVNELMPNVPNIWVRPDIFFHNSKRSGFLKAGEYAMTLTFDGTNIQPYYYSYLEGEVNPVYEVKVDDVAILKVWKNDREHTKLEYSKDAQVEITSVDVKNGEIKIVLSKVVQLSNFDLSYTQFECRELETGTISVSQDGTSWKQLGVSLPSGDLPAAGIQPSNGMLYYPFLSEIARQIKISFRPGDACLGKVTTTRVYAY